MPDTFALRYSSSTFKKIFIHMSTKTKTAADTNAFADLGDALGSAADRFESGAADARESAKRAAGNAQRAVKVGVYNVAYGLSYGLVYSTVFLTELLPKDSTFRRGLEEGADAAFEAQSLKEVEDTVSTATPKQPTKSKPAVRSKKAGTK